MKLKTIALTRLRVNPTNDRHGALPDEASAIAWLLRSRSSHMKNLARDIAKEARLYEAPLVHELDGEFLVFDGNRRVTCLKLLNNPSHAPTAEWRKAFVQIASKAKNRLPSRIPCQIEDDREAIDEILFRRHTGAQAGVGQSAWDNRAKTNFVERTGKRTKIDVAEQIELVLIEKGLVPPDLAPPRTNINRLLSAENWRNRVGIAVEGKELRFTHNEDKVLTALERIVTDFASRKLVLADVWSNSDKRRYLDDLDKEGILPTAADLLSEPADDEDDERPEGDSDSEEGTNSGEDGNEAESDANRPNLIPSGTVLIRTNNPLLKRFNHIWFELQRDLFFDKHTNAISVLFRVLLELAIENYVLSNDIGIHENDKLKARFRKCLIHMHEQKLIDKNLRASLSKFERQEPIFSTHTMNQYVHSSKAFPSPQHLRAMWDYLEPFVLICVKK